MLTGLYTHACSPSRSLSLQTFTTLARAHSLALPDQDAAALFRAFDRTHSGTVDLDSFLIGVAVLLPTTPHRFDWIIPRSAFIFRLYDANNDRHLSFPEFTRLIRDLRLAERKSLDDAEVARDAQGRFFCENAFTEDSFLFAMSEQLSALCRLPMSHPLVQQLDQLQAPPSSESRAAPFVEEMPSPSTVQATSESAPNNQVLNDFVAERPPTSTVESQPWDTSRHVESETTQPDSQKWTCAICTYANHLKSRKCVMCASIPASDVTVSSLASPHVHDQQRDTPRGEVPSSNDRQTFDRVHALLQRVSIEDTLWHECCRAAFEGKTDYFTRQSIPTEFLTRKLTSDDALILNEITDKPDAFVVDMTIFDIALSSSHQDIITLFQQKPAQAVDPLGLKRQAQHVSKELAEETLSMMFATLVQHPTTKCFAFESAFSFSTFVVTRDVWSLSHPSQVRFFDQCTDRAVQERFGEDNSDSLDDARNNKSDDPARAPFMNVFSWFRVHGVPRFLAFWNGGLGDCLLDAITQALIGVCVSTTPSFRLFRSSLHATMTECGGLRRRWEEAKAREFSSMGFSLERHQWISEWQSLLDAAASPRKSLFDFHIFVLAQMIRRPIIVYSESGVKNSHGSLLQQSAGLDGIYLPVMWPQDQVFKQPIAIAYTRGHYSAMIACESATPSQASARHVHVGCLPLKSGNKWMNVPFLTNAELDKKEAILSQYVQMDCDLVPGQTVATQTSGIRIEGVSRLLERWLAFYEQDSR
eukprot:m.556478 g.556478  ORF g.556478 m.556478 type:complete len:757 (-) comp57753_c0_seq80:3603-5873(-)